MASHGGGFHSKQSTVDSDSSTTSSSMFSTMYESRATTPDFDEKTRGTSMNMTNGEIDTADASAIATAVGILPEEVYNRTMSWWRAAVRRQIVRNVAWESNVLAAMQKSVRRPFLDAYFVYTSSLGTHTFFMTVLPIFFFFGYPDIGRGLLFVLAWGVYASSFVKDLICAPRPYAPPVTRLTIGSHHLEYGFPSTHSTNSMSIALYIFSIVYSLYTTPTVPPESSHISDVFPSIIASGTHISSTTFYITSCILTFYIFSIVYGRLYTGMHSFTDCFFGVLLGTLISGLYVWFHPWLDWMVARPSWLVPTLSIPLTLLLVNRHPQPVDDCPCFEDAIAFMSVVLGEMLVRWFMIRYHFDATFFVRAMPGHVSGGSWTEMWAWWSTAAAKMVVGIMAIFAWRIFAKFLLHRVLPPTFRLLAKLFTLPSRRFYTPATDYKNVPPEREGLRPIPSVIDLPGMLEMEVDGVGMGVGKGTGASYNQRFLGADGGVKNRNGGVNGKIGSGKKEKSPLREIGIEEMGGKDVEVVKHYDADVLTKVFVYCGIGIIATGVMPIMFEVAGWGAAR